MPEIIGLRRTPDDLADLNGNFSVEVYRRLALCV
jgi:hypothetical protein